MLGSVRSMGGAVEAWRRLLRWIREHPLAADTMLAVALMVLALVIHYTDVRLDSRAAGARAHVVDAAVRDRCRRCP